jgi:hypothetical protein
MAKLFKNVWFHSISVLLIIAVVLGGLLAVLSDVLYVSPAERTGRAVKKIYGEEKSYQIILDVDGETANTPIEYSFGKINKIYQVGDSSSSSYDMLFQTVGFEGYKNGTITVWVKVSVAGEKYSIEQVLLESFDKQTLMSKLGGDYYGKFNLTDVTNAYDKGEYFGTQDGSALKNPVSGATYSANAGNNAVNCVIKYLGENA